MSAAPLSSSPLPLIAALPEHPAFSDSIVYQLNGLVVVFCALSLIWGVLEVMAVWFRRKAPAPAADASAGAAPAASAPADAAPPAEAVAAIAAAVHLTLGGTPQVTSVVRVEAPDHEWGLEGRRQIHSARKVR